MNASAGYQALRHVVFGEEKWLEDPTLDLNADRPPEDELQSRWFAGEFGRKFQTTTGETIEIVQFGTWNHAAGPDFSEVALLCNGHLRTGSLELDGDARDWERHGHAQNPSYDEVVLHVFFEAPHGETFFTRTSQHRVVPQVLIDLHSYALVQKVPERAEVRWGRCSFPLQTMDEPRLLSLLRAAAQQRIERKARRLERLAAIHGWDEALFQEIAAALGYRRNQWPMRMLAQRLPLKFLALHKAGAEALLLGTARFISAPREAEPADTREYLRELWQTWWKYRDEFAGISAPRWVLAGTRPVNHPQRRMAALAQIALRWKAIRAGFEANAAALKTSFEALSHPYWDHHYTLTSTRSPKPLALVGTSRVADLLANIAFPRWSLRLENWWASYAIVPAILENEKSRRAAVRLLGQRPDAKRFCSLLYQQQALLQIYEDFCLQDHSDCERCQFPEQLAQWNP